MVPKTVKQTVQKIKAINQAMTAVQSDPTGIRGLIAARWGR